MVPAPPREFATGGTTLRKSQGLAVQVRSLAAKVAALEADMLANNAAAELSGRAWQAQADAAGQASLDDPEVVLEASSVTREEQGGGPGRDRGTI